ncbi:pimeloyl-CoA dehydrogenase large subunit [Cupriavidus sp. UYMMa02A]|nr:pimeloyl-CoA dehydrogenase large subunit [Cupriavidus sp. UYMMa02A]
MNLTESIEEKSFRNEVRDFVTKNLPADIKDKVLTFRHLAKEDYVRWHAILDSVGWSAPSWPVEYGGTGWSGTYRTIFEEECLLGGAPRLLAHVGMIGPVLINYGTEQQKDFFLQKTRALELLWCQGYSEPGAGSDLASLKTRADREGDHYVVNGQKTWTSLSHWADWMFALVRTSQTERPQDGISFLLIDMNTPGITRRQIRQVNGADELTEVFFDQVKVPVENLVGDENKGWTVAKSLLQHERMNQADIGLCARMMRRLKEVAMNQEKRGRPLLADPVFRARVSTVEAELMAHQWAIKRTLSLMENGDGGRIGIPLLKLGATAIVQKASELLMECAGPDALPFISEALNEENSIELPNAIEIHTLMANYLDWRKISIYGGTTEVTKGIVAKQIGL